MVKVKQNRIYDKDGFRRRAACLCVRDDHESEILLVTSSRSQNQWIVPGGGVEPNEDVNAAAIRETLEEAGVKGSVKRCLGEFEVCGKHKEPKHRTSVFVLLVQEELSEWEDSKSRKRSWFPIKEALELLSLYKPVQSIFIKLLVATNPASPLCESDVDRIIESVSSAKTTSTMVQHLEVKHYPNLNRNNEGGGTSSSSSSNNTPTIQTIAYTSGIYLSTDSETNDDGSVEGNNHCSNNN